MHMRILALAIMAAAMANPASGHGEPAGDTGRITGVGGIFFKSKDPKALSAWYRDVLGMPIENWGGAGLRTDAPGHPPMVVWGVFPENSDYFAPSQKPFMINLAVDDMDAFLARIEKKGVKILKRNDDDPNGKFAWIVDPEGNKIELWQPNPE